MINITNPEKFEKLFQDNNFYDKVFETTKDMFEQNGRIYIFEDGSFSELMTGRHKFNKTIAIIKGWTHPQITRKNGKIYNKELKEHQTKDELEPAINKQIENQLN